MALQSRPEPMNASPHHSKVKTSLKFAETLFVAGGVIAGKMEMECKAEKDLGIGVIMVELFAIEELTSRDHSATSTFLHSRRIFQGPGLPPSNSVHPYPQPGDPPLPADYYPARRGITTFLFRFPLPDSSPSSIDFGSGLASVRYEVRASVGVLWRGERKLVTDKKKVDVVERFETVYERVEPEGIIVGENGKIWVHGSVTGGVVIAGQPTCVELQVKNHSLKKNTGLSITLTRDLHLPKFASAQKMPLQVSDTLTSISFRGSEYIIHPGAEGVANLVFDVPLDARGLKGGMREGDEEGGSTECLFEVRCLLAIKMSMGIGSKDIHLDLPVTIVHPAALPAYPETETYPLHAQAYDAPMHDPAYQAVYHPSTSPAPYDAHYHPYEYHNLPASPPALPYVDHGQVWFPPPQSPHYYPFSSPPLSGAYYNYAVLQGLSAPYMPPPRPSSAEPIPSQPMHPMPSGLPLSTVQQSLLPLTTGISHPAERGEGKGDRASRIAHHLRMSSRHRSVSPQAHRYSLPSAPELHVPPSATLAAMSTQPQHNSSPSSSPQTQMHISMTQMSGDVVSPRPMPSPKQTYTVDPFTLTTLSKSERVKALEHMAAQALQENADMSGAVSPTAFDKDKTLPIPPVPSGKEKIYTDIHTRADTLFPPDLDDDGALKEAPPTPTLAAITSLKVPRSGGSGANGGMNGLDALEARLLAGVGTRKPEQDDKRPDVRSVLPMPIAIPRPADVQDPGMDSAISSLNLPGLSAEDPAAAAGKNSRSIGDGEMTEIGRGRRRSEKAERSSERERERRVVKKKSARKEHACDDKDDEVQRLRKAAQGRVAAWLGNIEPDIPPQASTPPSASPAPSTRQFEAEVNEADSRAQPEVSAYTTLEDKSGSDITAKPNPRSSGFVPIGTLRTERLRPPASAAQDDTVGDRNASTPIIKAPQVPPQRLAAYPPRTTDPEKRYDVRSARGGRGGKVTAVASIWASAVQERAVNVGGKSSLPPRHIIHPRSPLRSPQIQSDRAPIPHLKPLRPPGKLVDLKPLSAPKVDPMARRAQQIKSSSSPAALSSSFATPVLSSTASLARPPRAIANRIRENNKQLPSIAEPRSNSESKPSATHVLSSKGELAFGQARLRELIKRYQGQAN